MRERERVLCEFPLKQGGRFRLVLGDRWGDEDQRGFLRLEWRRSDGSPRQTIPLHPEDVDRGLRDLHRGAREAVRVLFGAAALDDEAEARRSARAFLEAGSGSGASAGAGRGGRR